MKEQYTYTNTKGTTYYLNCKEQTSAKGAVTRLYYFSKAPTERTISTDEFPPDREVKESGSSSFPILKKKVAE